MTKIYSVLVLSCLLTALQAQNPLRYSRVEISLQEKSLQALAELGIDADHGLLVGAGRSVVLELSNLEIDLVQKAGFDYKVHIPDLQQYGMERSQNAAVGSRGGECEIAKLDYPTPVNYTYGTMNGYLTYQQMLDVLDDMAAKYPNLITARAAVSDTIVTWENRPVWYLKISDNPGVDENEPEMLYTALHHAREPNSASQMIYYMWYLLENYATNPEVQYIVNNAELFFVPCVNPDGYVYNETTNPDGFGYWRKNRRNNGDGTYGVDLNRNYGYFWGLNNAGSSPSTTSETYRGPGPFSEPETRMMRDFCLAHNFLFTLNCHTSGNLFIYPWAYSNVPADSALVKFARLFTRENNYRTGTNLETLNYYVNGNSDDWMLGEAGIFAFTPEVGTTGFWPMPDEIDDLNKDNMWQNLSCALSMLKFGIVQESGENLILQQNGTLAFSLTRYGFQSGPLTVRLKPISGKIVSPPASQVFDIQQFATVDLSFPYSISPDASSGDELLFQLELDNGSLIWIDTLYKRYDILTQTDILFVDQADNTDKWFGDWGTTDEYYVSEPSSFTDSPGGPYLPFTNSILIMADPLAIPADAKDVYMQFFTRWFIGPNLDYAQVRAYDDNGGNQALCGRYTRNGSGNTQPAEPLYAGLQDEWVEERMSLNEFKGQSIYISFELISNSTAEYDGFYFDDLSIVYTDTVSNTQTVVPLDRFVLRQNQPNPASGLTTVAWENRGQYSGDASLMIFNALGEIVSERAVNLSIQNQLQIETREWPAGLYTYLIRTANVQTQPMKMSVMH